MLLEFLGLLSRWAHILAAITAVGGTIYQRLVLFPALAELPEQSRDAFREVLRKRWARFVGLAIAFLIASGLYNLITTLQMFKPPVGELPSYYHPLFGIKFLLAIAVFFFASALAGKSPGTAKFRENAPRWLTINLLLMLAIVVISGVLRMSHVGPNP